MSEDSESQRSDVMVAAATQNDDVMQSDDDIMGSGYQGDDDTYFDDEDHYDRQALLGDQPAQEALVGNQPAREALLGNQQDLDPITVSFQCEYITGQPAGVSLYCFFCYDFSSIVKFGLFVKHCKPVFWPHDSDDLDFSFNIGSQFSGPMIVMICKTDVS